MTPSAADRTRQERLAAKLRENLRRRKAQARQLSDDPAAQPAALSNPPGDG